MIDLAAEAARVVTQIQPRADGSYEPDPEGPVQAALMPAYDGRDLADVIAWPLRGPARWWWRTGAVPILGADAARRSWWDDGTPYATPVLLVETPARWLDRGGCGAPFVACIIDWRADLRGLLGMATTVQCETPALARRLRTTLENQRRQPFTITVARPAPAPAVNGAAR